MAICVLLCRFSDQYPRHGYWYAIIAITNKEDLFRQGIIYYLDTRFAPYGLQVCSSLFIASFYLL